MKGDSSQRMDSEGKGGLAGKGGLGPRELLTEGSAAERPRVKEDSVERRTRRGALT